MDAQELRNLQEAYMKVVENQQLDEEAPKKIALYPASPRLMKDAGPARVHNTKTSKKVKRVDEGYEELPVDKMIAKSKSLSRKPKPPGAPRWGPNDEAASRIRKVAGTHSRAKVKKVEQQNRERGTQREEYDLYDIILSHLLDEGYAETPEAAERIMVNMSEEWRESIVEAEGSYGQTPTARKAYGDLANKRRETPASEFSKRGEKTQKVKSAQKHFDRTGNPDAGNRGKKSTKPSWHSYQRQGMTQKDRTNLRGQSEYGHIGHDPDYHGSSGPGSKPKGKKLERQRKTGVSAD
jgi:hypothetical protein